MLSQLHIENYRGIKALSIEQLSLVNLLVGTNNSGKTSILECIELLTTDIPAQILGDIAHRRGEMIEADLPGEREVDVRHFFPGHMIQAESQFSISDGAGGKLVCSVVREDSQARLPFAVGEAWTNGTHPESFPLLLLISSPTGRIELRVSSRFGINAHELIRRAPKYWFEGSERQTVIPTEGPNDYELSVMWDQIALTPGEDEVIRVLQIIEPTVERIAFLARRTNHSKRGGIVLKLKDTSERVPLGSFGDGMRRLLAIAFAVVRSAGGVVLIDEIDTGLHFSVMSEMWRALLLTAQRLKVQIFATTHSQDCLDGLAGLYDKEPELASKIVLHRVKSGVRTTTAYTADEIEYASRRHIEVR